MKKLYLIGGVVCLTACSMVRTTAHNEAGTTSTTMLQFFDGKASAAKLLAETKGTNLQSRIGSAESESSGSNATHLVIEVIGAVPKPL